MHLTAFGASFGAARRHSNVISFAVIRPAAVIRFASFGLRPSFGGHLRLAGLGVSFASRHGGAARHSVVSQLRYCAGRAELKRPATGKTAGQIKL